MAIVIIHILDQSKLDHSKAKSNQKIKSQVILALFTEWDLFKLSAHPFLLHVKVLVPEHGNAYARREYCNNKHADNE